MEQLAVVGGDALAGVQLTESASSLTDQIRFRRYAMSKNLVKIINGLYCVCC